MRFLFTYLLFVYIVLGFSVVFRDSPGSVWRAALSFFFGPLLEIYDNIRLGLTWRLR